MTGHPYSLAPTAPDTNPPGRPSIPVPVPPRTAGNHLGWPPVVYDMITNRSRLVAALVAGALLLVACGSSSEVSDTSSGADAPASSSASAGPPAFSAQTLSGAEIDSASFKGKPTVLWFWAPWCTVCRAEGPDVAEVAEEFKGQVELIGVAGRGEVPAMKGFVDDTGTGGFTHAVDADGSIWADYGVAAQPAFAFIDSDGKVSVTVGSLTRDDLTKRMKALATA